MGFVAMSEYSPGNYPTFSYVSNEYVNCSNAMTYRPIDVSGLKSAVSGSFDSLLDNLKSDFKGLNNEFGDLKDCFGTKFIAINGSELGMVDVDSLNEYLDTFNNTLATERDKIMEIVDVIVSKTEAVNDYLQQLQDNYDKYLSLKNEYNDYTDDYNNYVREYEQEASKSTPDSGLLSTYSVFIDNIGVRLKELEAELSFYENNKLTSPEGSWVLG